MCVSKAYSVKFGFVLLFFDHSFCYCLLQLISHCKQSMDQWGTYLLEKHKTFVILTESTKTLYSKCKHVIFYDGVQ